MAWLDEQLAAAGRERTGEVEQPHLRPWATALTAPTSRGPVWLKASGPGTAFEAGLYGLLSAVVPERVLTPIAVDAARGWLLLPDGGPPLGDRLAGDELVQALECILPLYGQLQRDLAPHAGDLLALGVSDMRPAAMPARLEEALEAVGPAPEREAVAARRADFALWCRRLAELPGSPSVDHNDLHPWNMLVGRLDRPGEVRFYDWGDAVVAHPMASMLVPLASVRSRAGAAGIRRLRDAYLEPFGDLAPRGELAEALELACRVGAVARSLVWHRAVSATPPDELDADFARAPLRALLPLLDA